MEICFDKIDESETGIENTSLHHHLFKNHNVTARKGKIKKQLPLEHIFGFCRTIKKTIMQIGFRITLKTANLQDINYATVGDHIKVNFDKLFYMYQYSFPTLKHKKRLTILSKKVLHYHLIVGVLIEKPLILS